MTTSKTENVINLKAKATVVTTKIQTFFRGHASRKKFALRQIHEEKLENYKVHIAGNDPEIKGLPQHSEQDNIALVATSGFRSVELACQLSRGNPKLIIVDNSKQVVQFWRQARQLALKSASKQQFLCKLKLYLTQSKCNNSEFHQKDLSYLEQLFQKYNEHQVKRIIGSVTVLAQSWTDKSILVKIKNILSFSGINTIYAYPSNIVAYLHIANKRQSAQRVLENIAALNPKLAIHTDLDPRDNESKNVVLISNHNKKQVTEQLKLSKLDNYAVVEVEPNKLTLVDIEGALGILAAAFIKRNRALYATYDSVLTKVDKSKIKITLSRMKSENSMTYTMLLTLNLMTNYTAEAKEEWDANHQVKASKA